MKSVKKAPIQWGSVFGMDLSKNYLACLWMSDGTWGFPCTEDEFMRKLNIGNRPNKCKVVKHLPTTWCKILGIKILDPDGWREDNKSWKAPLTEAEFRVRMNKSTLVNFTTLECIKDANGTAQTDEKNNEVRHTPDHWLTLFGKDPAGFPLWKIDSSWHFQLTRFEFLEYLQFELFRRIESPSPLKTSKSQVNINAIAERIKDTNRLLAKTEWNEVAFAVTFLENQKAILQAILDANS